MINLYESYHEALHAVQELEAASIASSGISLITLNGKRSKAEIVDDLVKVSKKDKKHAKKDTVIAAIPDPVDIAPHLKADFFATLDLKELAGIGDVIAAGWLIEQSDPTLQPQAVNTVGRVIDLMVQTGVTQENAQTYIEGIRRGATLIGVRTDEVLADTVIRILREEHCPLDPHMRGHHYWQGEVDFKDKNSSAANRLLAVLITDIH